MPTNKSTIEKLIRDGKTEKAITQLLLLTERFDRDVHTSAIMLSSRYNSLSRDKNMGVIAQDDATINENRIIYAISQLLEDLKDDWEIRDSPSTGTETANQKTILILAVNPLGTEPLRLDEEVRGIDEGLQRSKHRDKFKLVQKWAVRRVDLRRALLDENPSILHFSGHGSPEGRLILEDEAGDGIEMPPKAIGNLFSLFSDKIECVLLNACYSESQAQEIARHIPFVIGMNDEIPDDAAIVFSSAFYDAIGNGKDFEFAFRFAQIAIETYDMPAEQIPVLIKKSAG